MPTVETTVVIKAPVEKVYELARDIERFPQFMEDVEEVEVLEQTADRQVSRWVGNVKQVQPPDTVDRGRFLGSAGAPLRVPPDRGRLLSLQRSMGIPGRTRGHGSVLADNVRVQHPADWAPDKEDSPQDDATEH